MAHRLPIVDAKLLEQSDKFSKYILITSVGTKYVWKYSSEYHPSWKEKELEEGFERIKEAHTILLDWIKNKEGNPASISWNCYGYALLYIQFKNIYNTIPEYNNQTSEINSLETDSNPKWVKDKHCPFIDDVLLNLSTKVRLRFDNGVLLKSYIEHEIFEKLEEHIDAETAVWIIHGSTSSADRKTHTYWIKLVHNTKNYYITKLTKEEMIQI